MGQTPSTSDDYCANDEDIPQEKESERKDVCHDGVDPEEIEVVVIRPERIMRGAEIVKKIKSEKEV